MKTLLLTTVLLTMSTAPLISDVGPAPKLELKTTLLGAMQLTSYRSVKSQTDESPFYTSIGVHTNPYILAVSQDLLKSGRVKYGDVLYVEGFGFKIVADCMNKRHKNAVDLWVETKEQERHVGVRKVNVWKIAKNINSF